MRMKLLDRYIGRELCGGVLQGTFWFGAMMIVAYIMGPLINQMVQYHLRPLDILSLGLLKLPETVRITLPMATLFGTLIAIGRLSGEGELTAILTSGTSFNRLLVPVLGVGVLLFLISLLTDQFLVPPASAREESLLNYFRMSMVRTAERLSIVEPRQGAPRRRIDIQRWDENPLRFYNISVVDLTTDERGRSTPKEAIYAAKAEQINGRWVFTHVKHYVYGIGKEEGITEADTFEWGPEKSLPDPNAQGASREKPHTMDFKQLSAYVDKLQQQQAPMTRVWEAVVEFHNKLAFPVACIIFALMGTPLGIQRQRTSTSLGLGISLVVIIAYYVIWKVTSSLGENGGMNAALSSWVANIIAAAVGVGLLWRAQK